MKKPWDGTRQVTTSGPTPAALCLPIRLHVKRFHSLPTHPYQGMRIQAREPRGGYVTLDKSHAS